MGVDVSFCEWLTCVQESIFRTVSLIIVFYSHLYGGQCELPPLVHQLNIKIDIAAFKRGVGEVIVRNGSLNCLCLQLS